jgi:hypothetical protein
MYTNDSELCCFILYPTFQELLLVRSTTQSKSSFVPGDKPGSSDSPSVILQLFSSFSLVPADWRNRVSSYRGSKRNPPCTTSNFFCLSKFVIYLCGVLLRVETASVRVAFRPIIFLSCPEKMLRSFDIDEHFSVFTVRYSAPSFSSGP